MIDVAIAGAGPAGISCAVALKRRDPSLRVRVFDRARFPRAKPCGGGLTGHAEEAMRALGLELDVPFVACRRAEVRFGAVSQQIEMRRPVRVVRREELDASLVAQARGLGVEVREGVPLDDFAVEPDRVALSAGGGREEARVLVGADGVGSRVRKHILKSAGAADGRPIRLFRIELEGASAERRAAGELMLYDFSLMRDGLRGYFWIFPVPGGRLNVGLMHDPSVPLSGAELEARLMRALDRHGLSAPTGARGWPAWPYDDRRPIGAERLLLVGDAAGIDALTGEGIAVGMEEGPLAARAIANAFATGRFDFSGFGAEVRRATVGRELAVDRLLARMLYGGLGRLDGWPHLLSLILFDERMLALYGARVSGGIVLADQKRALAGALVRHLALYPMRRAALALA